VIRGLQRCVGTILFAWLATLAFGVSAEQGGATQVEQTPIERARSRLTATEQASRWGLTVEDWARYQSLMTGPRGTWSPNLDPVTALGMHAGTDAGRRRYAEILVRLERERTMRELAFEKVVQGVKRSCIPTSRSSTPRS
jgi:hypothetical protein